MKAWKFATSAMFFTKINKILIFKASDYRYLTNLHRYLIFSTNFRKYLMNNLFLKFSVKSWENLYTLLCTDFRQSKF